MYPPHRAMLSLLVALAPLAPCRAGEPASALDRLDPSAVPTEERAAGQPRDLVGLLGSHRGRHWGHVYCLAYSPDGKTLASGGDEKAVHLWDAVTLREVALLRHTDSVPALAFSPDGRTLAAGAADGTIRLWDLRGGRARERASTN